MVVTRLVDQKDSSRWIWIMKVPNENNGASRIVEVHSNGSYFTYLSDLTTSELISMGKDNRLLSQTKYNTNNSAILF